MFIIIIIIIIVIIIIIAIIIMILLPFYHCQYYDITLQHDLCCLKHT